MKRNWGILLTIATVIMAVDQITKNWVIENLLLGQTIEPLPFLAPLFQFTRSHNTGAAFGIFANAGDIFLVVSILIVLFMLYLYPRTPDDAWVSRLATGMVIGGALGNIIDRLTHEHVIDFIHYRIPGVISNVSNIADHAIVFGVILLMIDSWRRDQREKENDAPEPDQAIIDTHGPEE